MISITHFVSADEHFATRARTALEALAARPGYRRGTFARSTDDVDAWVLVTEWENVGSYRRALGSYEVKLQATALLGEALDLPTGFEVLLDVSPGGAVTVSGSDHA